MVRDVGGAGEDSLSMRGDLGRLSPLPLVPGLRNGDAVRLITGGVCVLDGGLLGRLIEGLSQDEKKSSPASAVEAGVPSVVEVATISVMTTSSGYLYVNKPGASRWGCERTPERRQ